MSRAVSATETAPTTSVADLDTLSGIGFGAGRLRGVDVSAMQDGELAKVESTNQYFQLFKSSTEAADGTTVLLADCARAGAPPHPKAGRWKLYENAGPPGPAGPAGPAGPTGPAGIASLANLAALAALPTVALDDGTERYIETIGDWVVLNKFGAGLAPATATMEIFSTSDDADARWFRQYRASEKWTTQTEWYIDSTGGTGNDENSGAVGAPLLTAKEFERRVIEQLGGNRALQNRTYNVHLITALVAGDRIVVDRFMPQAVINYIGTPTQVAAGIALTAVQAINRAANQAQEIEASGLAGSWTALGYVRRMIRITTVGARFGAVAWVLSDLGTANKRARISPFTLLSTTNSYAGTPSSGIVTPLVGDQIEVLDVMTLPNHPQVCTGGGAGNFSPCGQVNFQYMSFDEIFPFGMGLSFSSGWIGIIGCKVPQIMSVNGSAYVYGQGSMFSGGELEIQDTAIAQLTSCGFTNAWFLDVSNNARAYLVGDSIFQGVGGGAGSNPSAFVNRGGWIRVANVATFDNPSDVLIVDNLAKCSVTGAVYGTGNTNNIFVLGSFAQVTYTVLASLTATSSIAVLDFGGTTKAYVNLPFINTAGNQAGMTIET